MGLLDSIDEILSGHLERRVERARAVRGARLLGTAGRATVERVLSGAGTRRSSATPPTVAPATRAQDTSAASFETQAEHAGQQTAPQPRAPRIRRDGFEDDPEARTQRILEETKPLRGPTREERFTSAEGALSGRSVAPTTDELVAALRSHGLSPSRTGRDDMSAPVGQRLRTLAVPEIPDLAGDVAKRARARSAQTDARFEQIADERATRPNALRTMEPTGEA